MINEFFLSSAEMKEYSISERLIRTIIAFKANWKFADTVIKILVERNPDYREDPNEKCRVDGFLANRETAFEGYYRLEQIFEAEYGISEEIKELVNKFSEEYAEIALEKFGWRDEE